MLALRASGRALHRLLRIDLPACGVHDFDLHRDTMTNAVGDDAKILELLSAAIKMRDLPDLFA